MDIVELLKLLKDNGCNILGADMQMMTNIEKERLQSHNATQEDYIIPYWSLKIQLPDYKKDSSE